MLNWVWQGGAVALTSGVVLRLMRPVSPRARYAALWAALAAVLALPAVSWLRHDAGLPPELMAPVDAAAVVSVPAGWWSSTALILMAWSAWCVASSVRLALAWFGLRRIRRGCQPLPCAVEARLPSWNRLQTSGRQARLVISDRVGAAAVLGGRRPVIALAPVLVERLARDDLDRVIVHELAHVRRRDDVAHAVQQIVRIIAGWHPAIWWIGRRLELERELACDEMAVAITGSARRYARCLVEVAGLGSRYPRPRMTLAALAAGNLRRRIVTILGWTGRPSPRAWRTPAVAAGLSLALVAFFAGNIRAFAESTPAARDGSVSSPAAVSPVTPVASELPPPERQGRLPASPARTQRRNRPPPAVVVTDVTAIGRPDVPSGNPTADLVTGIAMDAALHIDFAPPAPRASAVSSPPSEIPVPPAAGAETVTPWRAAADGGVAIARGSQKAAVSTAGFFSRLGKRLGGVF